jgi:hypothetical protein
MKARMLFKLCKVPATYVYMIFEIKLQYPE